MRLPNARHELFCQRVAAGEAGSRAYMAAGYSAQGNSAEANASRLLRDAKVRARIDELLAGSAKEMAISKERLTQMLLEDRAIAHREGQAAAAGAITERIGKLHGFSFDPLKLAEQPSLTSLPKPESVIDFKLANKRYSIASDDPKAESA